MAARMQSFRRGLKRKEPGEDGGEGYQAGLTQFQVSGTMTSAVLLLGQDSLCPSV